MPENFVTMLGILGVFLLCGFVFGYMFARNRSQKAISALKSDIDKTVKRERGELSLEFAGELANLRSNLLGVARSYDGALKLIKENLPEDVELQDKLSHKQSIPAEIDFDNRQEPAKKQGSGLKDGEDQVEKPRTTKQPASNNQITKTEYTASQPVEDLDSELEEDLSGEMKNEAQSNEGSQSRQDSEINSQDQRLSSAA